MYLRIAKYKEWTALIFVSLYVCTHLPVYGLSSDCVGGVCQALSLQQ